MFASPKVIAIITDVNAVANRIEQLLKQFNEIVARTLNAKGRFEGDHTRVRAKREE